MGKYVEFLEQGDKVRIGKKVFPNHKVTTSLDAVGPPILGVLPSEFPTNVQVKKINEMVELSNEAKQELAAKRIESKRRNIAADFGRWGGDPYQPGVPSSFQKMLDKMKADLKNVGITLLLKNYTATKFAPQWFVYKDTSDRNAQGLPITINRFIRKYSTSIDSWTLKALKSLAKLNSSMKMWKSYARNRWNLENNLGKPEDKAIYVASRFRKRTKQAARKLARATGQSVSSISNNDIVDMYTEGAKRSIAGAQTLAQKIAAHKNTLMQNMAVYNTSKFYTPPPKDEVKPKFEYKPAIKSQYSAPTGLQTTTLAFPQTKQEPGGGGQGTMVPEGSS